jgi:hypothetical protein
VVASRSNRENRGARKPMQRVASIGQFRHCAGSIGFGTTPGGFMAKREPQIILKTDERTFTSS